MRVGSIADLFRGVAAKRLTAVEADTSRSNQHEFNGVLDLKSLFGGEDQRLSATFLYLSDDEDRLATGSGFLTWYDARRAHPTRSEYRLYFPATAVSELARENDLLVVARRANGTAVVVVAAAGSTALNQVVWLFGLQGRFGGFEFRELRNDTAPLGPGARLVLEQLGIETPVDEPRDLLPEMLNRFGGTFPPTRDFSRFARDSAPIVSVADDPDGALMNWLEHEENLFRALERRLVAERLSKGFGAGGSDVDAFIDFSLTVQNRRKSRAGYSAENHLEELFSRSGVKYSRGKITERLSRPDFLFPGVESYRDPRFPASRLTMLGVKTTCKDRWRQVLVEADLIPAKHLFTLEPSISEGQTSEMKAQCVSLVLPRALHPTFTDGQRSELLDVREFLTIVLERQGA
jgi:hypothetical protein